MCKHFDSKLWLAFESIKNEISVFTSFYLFCPETPGDGFARVVANSGGTSPRHVSARRLRCLNAGHRRRLRAPGAAAGCVHQGACGCLISPVISLRARSIRLHINERKLLSSLELLWFFVFWTCFVTLLFFFIIFVFICSLDVKVFAGVEWSTARTCYSQVSALSRVGISCRINLPPLADMDEPSDLHQLHRRLLLADTPSLLTTTFQGSESSSSTSNCGHFNGLSCPHTKELLHRIYGSEAQPDKTAKSFQDGENENNAHLNAAPPSSRPEIAATHYKISTSKSLMSWLMPVGIAMSATGVLLALWPKIAARKHS